ncbi:MAG TPA: cytochrome P450 [Pseudomonadota bacterium]|nr:cytochrome P450 [Pseudomonadota bacterium]
MTNIENEPVSRSFQELPRMPGLPLIGQLHQLLRDPLKLLSDAAKLGDLVVLRLGPYRAVLVNHPELARQVMVTSHRKVEKSSPVQRAGRALFGDGLLTSVGELHQRQRRLLQPSFSRSRIEGYGHDFVRIAAQHTATWQPGLKIDVPEEMTKLTLDIVGKTLFDVEVDEDSALIGELVDDVETLFRNAVLPFPELRKRLPLPSTRKLARARARLDAIVYRFIAQHRASRRDPSSLLACLLAARDEQTGEAMPDKQVRDEALTLLAAGHETSANALTWTLYLLSQHPQVQIQLQEELDAVLGGALPTARDFERLPLVRQVVSESLRLYPPAWLITLAATEELEVGGYQIPKDTLFFIAPWLLHRDARFFKDPLEFRPERWTGKSQDGMPKFAYLPFGGGPRICIGEHFALMEVALVLAVLLSRWRFELAKEAHVELLPALTLRAKHGLPMIIGAR